MTAARRHLDAGDLASVSSRKLAQEAGVSHTLVNYHFGSRDGLLAAAAALHIAPHAVVAASRGPRGDIDVAVLFRSLVAVWEHPEHGQLLAGFAREAASGGRRAEAVTAYLQHAVFDALTSALGREHARRVTIAAVGTIFGRYVLRVPVLTALSPAKLTAQLISMAR